MTDARSDAAGGPFEKRSGPLQEWLDEQHDRLHDNTTMHPTIIDHDDWYELEEGVEARAVLTAKQVAKIKEVLEDLHLIEIAVTSAGLLINGRDRAKRYASNLSIRPEDLKGFECSQEGRLAFWDETAGSAFALLNVHTRRENEAVATLEVDGDTLAIHDQLVGYGATIPAQSRYTASEDSTPSPNPHSLVSGEMHDVDMGVEVIGPSRPGDEVYEVANQLNEHRLDVAELAAGPYNHYFSFTDGDEVLYAELEGETGETVVTQYDGRAAHTIYTAARTIGSSDSRVTIQWGEEEPALFTSEGHGITYNGLVAPHVGDIDPLHEKARHVEVCR